MEPFTSQQQPAGHLRQPRYHSRSYPAPAGQQPQLSETASFNIEQADLSLEGFAALPFSQATSQTSSSLQRTSRASNLPEPATSNFTPLNYQWPFGTTSGEISSQPPAASLIGPTSNPQGSKNHLSQPTHYTLTDNMSALGIQYDSRYHGSPRMNYTWPASNEMGEQYNHPRFEPGTPYSQSAPIPEYARSLSSTPPRASLTPEQRELKRQRDMARRSTKTHARRDRSESASYVHSQSTTPDLDPRRLMSYTSSMGAASIPAHLPLPSHPQPYMAAFGMPMPQTMNQDMYGSDFSMPSNELSLSNYSMPYAPNTSSSQHMYPPRPLSVSSASDRSVMYTGPSVSSPGEQDQVRVVQQRPKPQCWEHGCNGRQFSTFSNLLRHQREKSGVAAKSSCPKCGAEFTRTTARNGHMAHEKCKSRRGS